MLNIGKAFAIEFNLLYPIEEIVERWTTVLESGKLPPHNVPPKDEWISSILEGTMAPESSIYEENKKYLDLAVSQIEYLRFSGNSAVVFANSDDRFRTWTQDFLKFAFREIPDSCPQVHFYAGKEDKAKLISDLAIQHYVCLAKNAFGKKTKYLLSIQQTVINPNMQQTSWCLNLIIQNTGKWVVPLSLLKRSETHGHITSPPTPFEAESVWPSM